MAIEPARARFLFSEKRSEKVEVSRLYPNDGFLYLDRDPDEWIVSNPADCLSVLTLELTLWHLRVQKIDSVSKLHNLQHLLLRDCFQLRELPENLGDLGSLTYLSLHHCLNIESLPNSIGKLSNLIVLLINGCNLLKELPANLGELLPKLSLLNIESSEIKWLPWSIAELSKLSVLLLSYDFRLQTLPIHLNDSIVISVEGQHVRKTLFFFLYLPMWQMVAEGAQFLSTPGYLSYEGDPRLWIQEKGLYSLVRILDLNLENCKCKEIISESIVDLPMLTYLYISGGCIYHLPVTLTKITYLSLFKCKIQCHIESCFDSLANLSTLQSLELLRCDDSPAHLDLPVSLTHLTLQPEVDEFGPYVESKSSELVP